MNSQASPNSQDFIVIENQETEDRTAGGDFL